MRPVYLLTLIAASLSLGLTAVSASATQVYKHVDEQGNVSFSDSPQSDNSEAIQVRPSQGISLPKPRQRAPEPRQSGSSNTTDGSTTDESTDRYQSIRITQPEDDTAFWRTSGQVAIQVSSEPELRDGHSYQLELDGENKKTQRGPIFTLENVDRGTHEAIVHIVDNEGRPLYSSEPSRFTVHRHSILNNSQ